MSKPRFEKMKYRVYDLPPEVDLFKEYPELRNIPGLRTKEADQNKVLRYGFYMYDPKSDLITEVPHLKDRKEQALTLAGYKKIEDKWEPEAMDLLHFNRNANLHAIMFVIITSVFHSRKFRNYHTLFQELNEYTKLRWTPVGKEDSLEDAKKKTHLREQCSAIDDELDILEKEIFGDDSDITAHVEEMLMTNPESVAAAYRKEYAPELEPTAEEHG